MRLNELSSGFVNLQLQPQAALSEGRRPLGGMLLLQPSSLVIVVVEHKAQTHFEGLLHSFLLLSIGTRGAPLYFREGHVRQVATAMYSAV